MGQFRCNSIALYTLVRKETVRVFRIWPQTLLPPIITTTLYFLIFGTLIGHRIGSMQGLSYMNYIMPGLIMMQIISSSYMNVSSSFFGAKFSGHIEELLVAPVSESIIIWGYVFGGVARGVVTGILVAIVALFFTRVSLYNLSFTLVVAVLTAILFSFAGLVNGVFAKKFDDVTIIPTFILTPLTYLGGIFYSVNLLPDFFQKITHFNPIFYMVNAFREGVLGVSDIHVGVSITVILGFLAALYGLCFWLLHKGVGTRS